MTTRPLTLALLLLPLWAGAQIREDQTFAITSPTAVWYGAGAKFTTKTLLAGTHKCSNSTFGDPNYGVVKTCRSTAFVDTVTCYPAQLGGTGSRAAWGVSLSPVQAWAGWWCDGRLQVVACAASGCLPDTARRVLSTTSNTLNTELKSARTEHIDSPALRAVWEPHMAEIVAARP
jgi:hypothetical protein